MVVQMVFFVSAGVSYSLVEKLTVLLVSKDKNPRNEEALQLEKIYKQAEAFPKKHVSQNERGKYQSKKKKKQLKSTKNDLLLFYFTILNGFLSTYSSSFIFSFLD